MNAAAAALAAFTAVELATIAAPVVAAVVGFGQIAVVWYGIRAMIGANKDRAAGAAEAARQADQRHAETMVALTALIERTAPDAPGARFRRRNARIR